MPDESILYIKDGTTSPITMQLLADGNPIDLTSVDHVEVSMLDALRNVYHFSSADTPSYVAITYPVTGTINFTPPTQLIFRYNNSPYKIVIWAVSASGQRYAVPGKSANIIIVQPEF